MDFHGFCSSSGRDVYAWRLWLTWCKLVSVYVVSTQKEQTRLRLLGAARRLLVERGFHSVGLEDIAEAAGVSRQAVYKSHFASKAELLLELVRFVHVAENLDELTRPVFAAPSGVAMLEASIVAIVRIEARVHDIGLVLAAAAVSDTGAATAFRDRTEVKRGALRGALERTRGEGRLRPEWPVAPAVDLLSVLLSVEAYETLVVGAGWSPDAMSERVWEICERVLLTEGSAGKRGGRSKGRRAGQRSP
jgi:AcrR family transcriptional regulator